MQSPDLQGQTGKLLAASKLGKSLLSTANAFSALGKERATQCVMSAPRPPTRSGRKARCATAGHGGCRKASFSRTIEVLKLRRPQAHSRRCRGGLPRRPRRAENTEERRN